MISCKNQLWITLYYKYDVVSLGVAGPFSKYSLKIVWYQASPSRAGQRLTHLLYRRLGDICQIKSTNLGMSKRLMNSALRVQLQSTLRVSIFHLTWARPNLLLLHLTWAVQPINKPRWPGRMRLNVKDILEGFEHAINNFQVICFMASIYSTKKHYTLELN